VDKVRYDNLNSAVKQVLFGRSRQKTNTGSPFAATTVSKPGIASPAMRAATKKAAWKARVGGFRRNHCVPMPMVESVDELNALLATADDAPMTPAG
jgi:FKBP-type peptidyl-prolyl cis-trans isomerase (trigger factor)